MGLKYTLRTCFVKKYNSFFFKIGRFFFFLIFFNFEKKKFLFFYNSKYNNELKENLKKFFDKTQNHNLFISPKRKKAVLEMVLKSFILSKLDHQMSKSLKGIAGEARNPDFFLFTVCSV